MKNWLNNPSSRDIRIAAIALAIGIGVTWLIIAPPRWTGFAGKTLWDWLEIAILPTMILLGALLLRRQSARASHTAHEPANSPTAASNALHEAILQAYFDQMTELLLDRELLYTNEEATRQLARFRTLAALRGLDGVRKGLVVKFLHEARLIHAKEGKSPIIDLRDADLRGADLSGMELQYVSLKRAYLQGANLERANLNMAKMNGARLNGANLHAASFHKAEMIRTTFKNADLSNAELHSVNLVWAEFDEADLRGADLQWAVLLWASFKDTQFDHKTILPDHSNWLSGTDLGRYTDNKHPEFWSAETDRPRQRDIPTKDISTYTNDSLS